jgi:hypothetical protein
MENNNCAPNAHVLLHVYRTLYDCLFIVLFFMVILAIVPLLDGDFGYCAFALW